MLKNKLRLFLSVFQEHFILKIERKSTFVLISRTFLLDKGEGKFPSYEYLILSLILF